MTQSRLLLAVTVVLAATTVVFGVLGTLYNLILLVFAIPFALATGFLWFHVTGRLMEYLRTERVSQTSRQYTRKTSTNHNEQAGHETTPDRLSISQAQSILGVDPQAPPDEIRDAYRDRVMDAHPDTEAGTEDEFKRIRAAYERLMNGNRVNREGF